MYYRIIRGKDRNWKVPDTAPFLVKTFLVDKTQRLRFFYFLKELML